MQTNDINTLISSIKTIADKNTLIIFDVDRTLTIPCDLAIRENWRIIDKILKYYNDQQKYDANIGRLVDLINLQAQRCAVDELEPLFKYIHNSNIQTIALSSVSNKFESWGDWLYQSLKNVGIDFLEPSKSKNSKFNHGELYNGILLSSNAKVDCLNDFLTPFKQKPSKVIFISDKDSDIQSIQTSCNAQKINFYGIHYTKSLGLINTNSPVDESRKALEALQVQYLIESDTWLSDNDAYILLQELV